jgi:hypothetical protein
MHPTTQHNTSKAKRSDKNPLLRLAACCWIWITSALSASNTSNALVYIIMAATVGMAKVLLLLVFLIQIINVLTISAAARPLKAGAGIEMVVDMFGDKKQSGSNGSSHCCN